MKYCVIIILLLFVIFTGCRGNRTNKNSKPPVIHNYIENEFGNEDSLIKYQTPPVISDEKRESLIQKKDTI